MFLLVLNVYLQNKQGCRKLYRVGSNIKFKKNMAISNVQNEGSWIRVYDEKSKRISEMSASNKEVVGIGSDFFVTEEGSWIRTYDEHCKRIAEMSASGKEVRTAAGQTFTTKEGSWLRTYDKKCKRLSERSA